MLTAAVPTAPRLLKADFIFPFNIGNYGLLIPYPDAAPNIYAIVKPFQLLVHIKLFNGLQYTKILVFQQIWILILISIPLAIILIIFLNRNSIIYLDETPNGFVGQFTQLRRAIEYVVAVLLSQGFYYNTPSGTYTIEFKSSISL